MEHSHFLIAVIGMAFVTMACRAIPFAVLGKVGFSPAVLLWMKYLPVAILSAVVMPTLVGTGEPLWGPLTLPVLAAIPTAFIALRTRNLLASVLVGVMTVALLRSF